VSKKNILTIFFLYIGIGFSVSATENKILNNYPFLKISKEEKANLEQGEAIIRNVKNYRELGLSPFDNTSLALIERFSKLKPNYITELLLIIDGKEETEKYSILHHLAAALADVSGYVKIPYWSVKQQTTYDLFDKMEILSRTLINGGESINVIQHMEPFDDFSARYTYSLELNTLSFSGTNLQPIIYSYRNLQAVAPEGMIWELYAFIFEEKLYVYGVGGVNAFDLFGLFRDRLEPPFMGRVAAFFKHISRKIKE